MAKAQFIKYVGGAFLRGKDVAAYKVGEHSVRLVPETCGGKKIGPSVTVSAEKFEDLQNEWTEGGAVARGDVSVTEKALKFLGC